jgi:hypothetical protein
MDEAHINDIIGELEKIFGSDTCGIFKPCTGSTKLWQKIHDTKKAQTDAQGMLPIDLQTIRKTAIIRRPPGLVKHLFGKLTIPPLGHTLEDIPQDVRDNALQALISQLRKRAAIVNYDVTKSATALIELDSTIARLNVMSREDRKTVFDDVQKVVLSNIITTLVKKKQDIGVNADELRGLEIQIRTGIHGIQSVDEIYKLIHEYILHMYHVAPTPITTSADLLKFIESELKVLSASMSPYYQDEKDIIDFKIYLPLLERYIAEVLKEYGMVLAGDSRQIAESIMGIIKEHICAFVRIAGDPDICIRHTIVHNAQNLIIEGVRKFLSDYTPPTPDTQPSKKPRIEEGGNHSRIKKYKNRTKHRTKRRTKYRTKRKTKYITSRRYKIKNKKTRKIYKY